MDKQFSEKDQIMLMEALENAKAMTQKMEANSCLASYYFEQIGRNKI
ncbi:MAG: hypothetical protein JWN30_1005 [Bacilli bacterium]|nr:hypothetical protein [Bacilli bacterium]